MFECRGERVRQTFAFLLDNVDATKPCADRGGIANRTHHGDLETGDGLRHRDRVFHQTSIELHDIVGSRVLEEPRLDMTRPRRLGHHDEDAVRHVTIRSGTGRFG